MSLTAFHRTLASNHRAYSGLPSRAKLSASDERHARRAVQRAGDPPRGMLVDVRGQYAGKPLRCDCEGQLHPASQNLSEHGEYAAHIWKSNPLRHAQTHPNTAGAAAAGTGLALGPIWSLLNHGGQTAAT